MNRILIGLLFSYSFIAFIIIEKTSYTVADIPKKFLFSNLSPWLSKFPFITNKTQEYRKKKIIQLLNNLNIFFS